LLPKQLKLVKKFEEITSGNPDICKELIGKIQGLQSEQELMEIWHEEVFPCFYNLLMIQDKSNEDYFNPYIAARKKIISLIGESEADALLANLVAGSGELTSIGPLIGLEKLAKGEISRKEYTLIAGHRPQKENEIAEKRPYEDPFWIDKRLDEFNESPLNYCEILAKQVQEFESAWGEFAGRFPKQSVSIKKKLDQTSAAMEKREIIRSELTRSLGVIRQWFLKAGELTGLKEDIFLLKDDEVLDVLAGDESLLVYIPRRRLTYKRQKELPRYPMVISGRFDPYAWAKDPNRRSDYYDSHTSIIIEEEKDMLKGNPGSAGRVKGVVRIIQSLKESDQFKDGEVLVASSTNIGWTPLFPRAAAVVTDVGAPLSHAAIVAREFGIPAVVGTANATMRLKTGDRVLVDGSHGIVRKLNESRA
jgi:pyruvate,water dikinase